MKKFIIFPLLTILLAGCGDGYNTTRCRESVRVELKATDVFQIPRHKYYFIARDESGAVYYVETMDSSTNITAKTMIFQGNH